MEHSSHISDEDNDNEIVFDGIFPSGSPNSSGCSGGVKRLKTEDISQDILPDRSTSAFDAEWDNQDESDELIMNSVILDDDPNIPSTSSGVGRNFANFKDSSVKNADRSVVYMLESDDDDDDASAITGASTQSSANEPVHMCITP
ncbi:hypothetical protein RvY_05207 [Ramazzottius varieornatus]|uniref:Uncharacterized protein n=1 Tax=Ramazzottius varieornatus TaxID=947166 RepID=A0A1D1UUW4_RAMVA|nr:hypothetical protein RvY_05207 [Ramazzottius varieornatus]